MCKKNRVKNKVQMHILAPAYEGPTLKGLGPLDIAELGDWYLQLATNEKMIVGREQEIR